MLRMMLTVPPFDALGWACSLQVSVIVLVGGHVKRGVCYRCAVVCVCEGR